MKYIYVLIIAFFTLSNCFTQTIEEKIEYTYSTYNTQEYVNSVKYLKDIEKYLIVEKFDNNDIIDFYSLAIDSYIQNKNYENAIEFVKKKIQFLKPIQFQDHFLKDSIIIDLKVTLVSLNFQLNKISETDVIINEILDLSKYSNGFFLDVYNYFTLLKADNLVNEKNGLEAIELLKDLETYNLLYYEGNSIEMVDIYLKLGINFMENSEFKLAEYYLKKSEKIHLENKNEQTTSGVQTTIALGSLTRRLGDMKQALDYYDLAEKNGQEVFKNEPLLYSNLLQNKANILNCEEEFKDVEDLYLKTIEIRRANLGTTHFEYTKALVNLGNFYHTIGNLKKSELSIKTAEKILIENYGDNFIEISSIKNGLSSLYLDLDKNKEALELLNDALSIYKVNNAEITYEYALTLSRLASFYWANRNYKNAIIEFEKAIDLYMKLFPPNHKYIVLKKRILAQLYSEIGNYTKAKEITSTFIENDTLSSNYSLENYFDGKFFLTKIDLEKGFIDSSYQQQLFLLKKIKKTGYDNSERYTYLLESISQLEIYQNNFESAKKRLWELKAINIELYGENSSKVGLTFQRLADIYLKMGKIDSADFYLSKAYQIQVDLFGEKHPKTTDVLKDLAYLEVKKGNLEKGDDYFTKYISIEESNFLKNYLVLNETGMLEYKYKIETTSRFYIDNRINLDENLQGKQIIDLFEKWQNCNGINYSFNSRLRKHVEESSDTSIVGKYNSLKYEMAMRLTWQNMTNKARNNLKCNIDSLDIIISNLERELYFELELDLSEFRPITNELVSSIIDTNSFFISISELNKEKGNYLFSIYSKTNKNPILLRKQINSNDLIGLKQKDENQNEIFYNALWAHLEEYLISAGKIFISAEGIYSQLNVSTFFNSKKNKYILDYQEVISNNNLRSFIDNKTNKRQMVLNNTVSLYGFPDYNLKLSLIKSNEKNSDYYNLGQIYLDTITRGGFKVSPLPATKIEIDNINNSFDEKGWTVLKFLSSEANETNIKSEKSPRILHIATHGYFFSDIPENHLEERFLGIDRKIVVQDPMLRSGLLLSGANNTLKGEEIYGENGLLNASEVSMLDLKNTELVVLSACETGKGEVKNSEGVYGLRKAFSDAGAKNIIMSLWKVDDKVTQVFMTRFYEIWLNEKTTIREAFNKTQLEIKAKYPQPYYWGAFILVGE